MKIIAHRGFWTSESHMNSMESLLSAIEMGYSVETDLRDKNQEIVVSHDPPDNSCFLFSEFLEMAVELPKFKNIFLALNIKCDGIGKKLFSVLNKFDALKNSFLFDMSVPEHFLLTSIFPKENLCSRISDIEHYPVLYDESKWLWVDSFKRDWLDENLLVNHIKKNKYVVVVSPELHKRDHFQFWSFLANTSVASKIFLCTDKPKEADLYFNK